MNSNINQQCIRHQLHEFTSTKKLKIKEKKQKQSLIIKNMK